MLLCFLMVLKMLISFYFTCRWNFPANFPKLLWLIQIFWGFRTIANGFVCTYWSFKCLNNEATKHYYYSYNYLYV